jgi:hypothetical protein
LGLDNCGTRSGVVPALGFDANLREERSRRKQFGPSVDVALDFDHFSRGVDSVFRLCEMQIVLNFQGMMLSHLVFNKCRKKHTLRQPCRVKMRNTV